MPDPEIKALLLRLGTSEVQIQRFYERLLDVEEVVKQLRGQKEVGQLRDERDELAEWKRQHRLVDNWWYEIDTYVRAHPSTVAGESVVAAALRLLKDRDMMARTLGMINEASKTRYRVMPLYEGPLDKYDTPCPTS